MRHWKSAASARLAEGCVTTGPGSARASQPPQRQPDATPARARLPGAEIILLHRLRARAAATAGRLEHAHRVIELTARAWLS